MGHKIATLAAAAIVFGGVHVASAADMAVKAPMAPPVIATWSWTGFYVGIHGGYGWGRESDIDNVAVGIPPGSGTSFDPNGGIFGGQLGFRWQWNQLVLGIEGSGAWADLQSDVLKGATAGETIGLKVKSLYTVTGQVGWAMNQWLFYVKGGWAGARTEQFINAPGVFTGSNTQSNRGWTVGGGVDFAIWQNLIFGVEFDHFDFNYDGFTAPLSNGGFPLIVTGTSRLTVEQIVGRLSWKFP